MEFVDLDNDALEDVGGVDLVFDVIGGDIQRRSAGLIRAGGTLVTIVGPPETRPADGLAIDFVVESDRTQLREIVQRVRDGRLRTNIGNIATLDDAVAALNPTERLKGEDDHPRAFVRTRGQGQVVSSSRISVSHVASLSCSRPRASAVAGPAQRTVHRREDPVVASILVRTARRAFSGRRYPILRWMRETTLSSLQSSAAALAVASSRSLVDARRSLRSG
jgi:zinc-binding alcohol dehydrogenase family protein